MSTSATYRRRVLITGVAGFIGSNLADSLLQDTAVHHDIVGIDTLSYGVREQIPKAVDFHRVDIRSSEIYPLFEDVDYVFHLAAKNCISDCQADPVETMDINVTGTTNVLEASRRAGVKKVIYAESSALYEGTQQLPTPEEKATPQSFYAISKLAGMHVADTFTRFHGLRTTALRYFCVYGPRQDYRRTIPPVMSAFIIKLLRGEAPVIYGDGSKRRDFIHVHDINRFHRLCMEDPLTDGKVFNLGSGTNHSVSEIYELLTELLGVAIPCENRPDMPGEAQDTLADISRARSIGWEPTYDIRAGLEDMIAYIRREYDEGKITP